MLIKKLKKKSDHNLVYEYTAFYKSLFDEFRINSFFSNYSKMSGIKVMNNNMFDFVCVELDKKHSILKFLSICDAKDINLVDILTPEDDANFIYGFVPKII